LLKVLDLTSMLIDREATALRCVDSADWTVALFKGLEQVSVRPRQATDL
jgi:spore coat protein U-like protein